MDTEPVERGTRTEYVRQTESPSEKSPSEIEENEIAEAPVYHHECGNMFPEDVKQRISVLPEVAISTRDITIEDIQIGDPKNPLTTDQVRLKDLIWKSLHLLMGKINALPPELGVQSGV